VFETGRFAHVLRPEDPTISSIFAATGRSATMVSAGTAEEAARIAARADPGTILVYTCEGGDDEESSLENSVHVPLAIRYRGLKPRSAPEVQISHVDLMPTLLSLAGLTPPAEVHGKNLARILTAGQGELPDSVYVQGWLGRIEEWRALVRGYDKLVFNLREEPLHLYNLADDPNELTDLVKEPAAELTRDSMRALARTWMRRIGDSLDPSGLRRR
jgi:arylsulfatase A-like enzyme